MIVTEAEIVVPAKPFCSKCRRRVRVAVQFMAVSGDHGHAHPSSRGSKRTVRLCLPCIEAMRHELRKAKA